MAFDITPYVDMSPKKVRELIRKGVIDLHTRIHFRVQFSRLSKELLKLMTWVRAEISARISRNTGFMKTVYLQKKLLTLPSIGKRDMLDFLSAVLSHLKQH